MTLAATDNYPSYRVPQADGTALVQPSAEELLAQLGQQRVQGGSGLEFCGKSLDVAREDARLEVVRKAIDFTSTYRDLPPARWSQDQLPAIILSGHQPELFHAGVWFKNFLLSRLALESGAVAINFLVDNDLCRNASIRVPSHQTNGGAVDSSPDYGPPIARSIAFDKSRDAVPWELRRLESSECWQRFPAAVDEALLPMTGRPLLNELWPDATEAVRRTDRLGLAIAQARHRLEGRLGLQTLEVPLSHLVSTRAFARFSIQLLSELPRFQETYNSQLSDYRRIHRIRSQAHPVPALEQSHGWLEAPWWIYRAAAPKRQRMWVRLMDNQLILGDRAGWQATIEGRLDCDNAATQWLDLLSDGICLRPRALLTTMYLRLMVSELFLHGIGGGKYDQLTDGIVRQFFGIEPPPMAVATATLHLPLIPSHKDQTISRREDADSAATAEQTPGQARIDHRQKLWQLQHQAERFIDQASAEAAELVKRKQDLLAHIPPRGEKWQWHQQMTAINRRLSQLMADETAQTSRDLEELSNIQREQRVLDSREYSFCLYPLDVIAGKLRDLAAT